MHQSKTTTSPTLMSTLELSKSERRRARSQLSEHVTSSTAREIERGIFSFTEEFSTIKNLDQRLWKGVYWDKVADLCYNLSDGRPTMVKLLREIDGEEPTSTLDGLAYNLAFLTPQDLDAERWEDVLSHIQTTRDVLANIATIQRGPCPRCGCIDYFHQQHQTRSLDEPMTNFFICKDCDHVIKINC